MITSIIEQDLYKFTMGQVVYFLFPTVEVKYKFINRGNIKFPIGFSDRLIKLIKQCEKLRMTDDEYYYLKRNCPYLNDVYLDFLRNFKYDSSQVLVKQDNYDLNVFVCGDWKTTIFWEVVLLSLISELYYKMSSKQQIFNRKERKENNYFKVKLFKNNEIKFVDFGLRRRYSSKNHDEVVSDMVKYGNGSFIGTSNVSLAMKYGIKPIGTMAHEFIMAESALRGLRYANKYAMEDWNRIYRGDLGIMLTDTYGINSFLKDFDKCYAKQFDGVRHDSNSPYVFVDRMIDHYNKCGIDPFTKNIVFSDSLDVNSVIRINKYCNNIINCSFGIGTNLTNDIGVKPLNIVIKLDSVNNIPVVKLSDVKGKETGDKEAIKIAKWVCL